MAVKGEVDVSVDNKTGQQQLPGEEPPKQAVQVEREAVWGDYFRVFTYAKRWDFVLMVGAALASLAGGVTTPLMNVIFGRLVGNFTSFGTPGSSTTQAQFERQLNFQCLLMFILFLARFTFNYVSKFCFRLIGIRISAAIRLHYLSCLLSQTVHVLDSMPPGAAAGTITSTANVLQIGISEKLGTFLEFASCIVASIIVAFTFSWQVTLVTSSVVLFIGLAVGILVPFIIKGTSRSTEAETKAGAVATEAFSGIRMVYACGAQKRMGDKYSSWVVEAKKHGMYTSPFVGLNFALVFFGLYSAFALCFWYGTKAVAQGIVDGIGSIVVVLFSVFLMAISLERMSGPLIAASKATVAAATFFAVIDAPQPKKGTLKEPEVNADGDIVFEGVTFAYPGRPNTKVLDDLNLTIEAGKVTAIVGPSGSGKSTVVALVERWYTLYSQAVISKAIEKKVDKKGKKDQEKQPGEKKPFWARGKAKGNQAEAVDQQKDSSAAAGATPTPDEQDNAEPVQLSGSVVTAGHSLDEMDIKWWRSQIGLVQQEPFLFNDSIYANVMHGLVGTKWEDEPLETKQELVRDACKEAFADEFIDRLPDGYETQVGDSGLKLSGGQRQRIAIARSIVKKPKILILDEATSAIDVRSEKIIQAALDRVSKGRTTITIAHRLSTIAKADKIVVLQKGKLMEQGTHESLLSNDAGVYSGLVRAQRLTLGREEEAEDSDALEEKEEEDIQAILSREKSASKAITSGGEAEVESEWVNRGLIGSFGRLLYEQRSRFPFYALILIAASGIAAATPIQAWLFGQVLQVFTYIFSPSRFIRESEFWSLMWFIVALGLGFCYLVLGVVAVNLQHFICAAYRQQYFTALIRQKMVFFDNENNSIGTLASRVQGDPKQLEELLGMNMGMVVCSVLQLCGSLTISFVFGWKLALVATCVTVPIGLGCAWYRFKYEMEFEKMSAAVFAESSKWAAEAIGAFRCVSSLTLEDVIIERYQTLLDTHVMSAYRKARWTTLIFALSDSLSIACQALIFWYGGRLLATGEYQILNFFVCFMAVTQGAEQAGVGFSFGPNAAQASAAANRILSIRESRGEKASLTDETEGGNREIEKIPDSESGIKIELKDVGFRYPTRQAQVFKHLNITVEKGQFAALVGASGAGKSSTVALLERFYDAQQGSIRCNGRDITTVDVHEYRKLFSLVAQEASLFQGTIKENILLGVPDASAVTDAQLHQACQDAAIHDFIISLPEGYVGSRGVALSGGQKQRVSIARAIIRDPKVLLLDEATSSLDSESEKQISAALQRVAKGRTTVAVAHRLSTIQHADVIYVLGEGKVLEVGNHADLLKQKGVYYTMCQSQALDR
ncbi:bc transporter [Diaporthe amygdali]|uniref:bc transporter n=1 Tax=Phomopsis amygdali TaxID=1214568 RepID=UPI0022FE7710|nr:bc transporter [Diaporthe amygdali]KAJ0121413.1 bc transporter [Diaporthe amygdali]